jgi:hypothetical protein
MRRGFYIFLGLCVIGLCKGYSVNTPFQEEKSGDILLPFSLKKPVPGQWTLLPKKKLYPSLLLIRRFLYGVERGERHRDDTTLYARMQDPIKGVLGKKRVLPPAVFPWSGAVYTTLLPQNGGGKDFARGFADSFKNMWARQLYRHRVGGLILMMIGGQDSFFFG